MIAICCDMMKMPDRIQTSDQWCRGAKRLDDLADEDHKASVVTSRPSSEREREDSCRCSKIRDLLKLQSEEIATPGGLRISSRMSDPDGHGRAGGRQAGYEERASSTRSPSKRNNLFTSLPVGLRDPRIRASNDVTP